MKSLRLALGATVLVLSLGACNRAAPSEAAPGADAATSAGADAKDGGTASKGDSAWEEKVQAYIKVANDLRRFSSPVNETFAKWEAEAREKVKAGDFKQIASSSTFSDSSVAGLKAAAAMPGRTPELDAPAKALASALDAGLPAWRELEDYNKAKRYEDDAGAKGKELLTTYRTTLETVDASLAELEQQVDVAARIAHDKAVARFKEEGKLLEMHTWEATGAAEKVLGLFDSSDDFKDAARVKQADALIGTMESSITALRAEHVKRKAKDDSLPMIDRYDDIASKLTELAGHYRESRKDPTAFNDAVDAYNGAIDDLNMMNR